MLVPPSDKRLVVGSTIAYLPVELGHIIVDPTIVDPQQHIGIQVVIVLQTIGQASVRVVTLVAINTER